MRLVVLDQNTPTPDPALFPVRQWPCDSRNDERFAPCPFCDVEECPHGMCNAACTCDEEWEDDDEIA